MWRCARQGNGEPSAAAATRALRPMRGKRTIRRMSIWDYMKKSERTPVPSSVDLAAGNRVVISWDDGAKTAATARDLRAECPCAGCVDEFTRERTLDVSSIPADLGVLGIEQVGNYALSFRFSDGHSTGIYNWVLLRKICEEHPAAV